MTAITTNQFLDGGTARTTAEAFQIGSGARLTVRTDTRFHANAPTPTTTPTGSLGSLTYTDTGGEFFIDASAVRCLSFNTGSGTVPAIGTSITQGGVAGYLLGVWNPTTGLPILSGAAMPASGYMKFREVTGGAFAAGALTGITATATGADVQGWIEATWLTSANITVPRVGLFKSRGGWYDLGTTTGSVAQTFTLPTTSSTQTGNFAPGCWVEKYVGAGAALGDTDGYEFWTGCASAGNGWARTSLGYPEGGTDARGKFVKTFAGNNIQFGETVTLAATYASLAAQASTYAGVALTCTYTLTSNVVTVNTAAVAHLLEDGQQIYLDFTSGTATDGTYTVTVIDAFNFTVPLVAADTSGNATGRPGVTITFTAHGLHEGNMVYCNFTSGTGVDGTYMVYSVDSANSYKVAYTHNAALTGGNVSTLHTLVITSTAHGHITGQELYCDFTSGAGVDGRYTIKATAANTMNINMAHAAAITSSNVTLRWTIGHVPVSGLKVRIPNIIWTEAASGSASNAVPSAGTPASRPEFLTTGAGAIDIEFLYGLSIKAAFSQAYSARIYHCAFQDLFEVSECATALDINNVGVGQYGATSATQTLTFLSNFAAGTISKVTGIKSINVAAANVSITSNIGQTINNLVVGSIIYGRSTGAAVNLTACTNITFNNMTCFNSNVQVNACTGITLNNTDFNDRIIGKTNATSGQQAIVISNGCLNTIVNGLTTGMLNTIDDCHSYLALIIVTGTTNTKVRNIGTLAAPIKTGVWAPNFAAAAGLVSSGGSNSILKVQKCYAGKFRTAYTALLNSDKTVTYEQLITKSPYIYSAKTSRTEVWPMLNAVVKGCNTGTMVTVGQASVYGTHWYSTFQGGINGTMTLAMNEPTTETAAYYTNVSGVAQFTSAGAVNMFVIGAESIWEMPYFAKGHTGFVNTAAVMAGGTIGNYTITYQIDLGSGWNGTWNTLNGANLSAHTVSPTTGFKLKIKIVTGTANATGITTLRVRTTTTFAAQDGIDYPLDTNTLTLTGLQTGSDIVILDAGTSTERINIDANAGTTYPFVYSSTGNVDICVYKQGYIPFAIRNYSLTSADASLPIAQVADRNFTP